MNKILSTVRVLIHEYPDEYTVEYVKVAENGTIEVESFHKLQDFAQVQSQVTWLLSEEMRQNDLYIEHLLEEKD